MKFEDSMFSKRLAKAVLRSTLQNNQNLDVLRNNLVDLVKLFQEPIWNVFCKNTSISDRQKVRQLQSIYHITSDPLRCAVLLLVKKNQFLHLYSLIRQIFRQQWGFVDLVVAFGFAHQEQIRKKISEKYGALCGLNIFVDASILGGCVLFDGNSKIDTTVATALQKIRHSLHRFSRENTSWSGI